MKIPSKFINNQKIIIHKQYNINQIIYYILNELFKNTDNTFYYIRYLLDNENFRIYNLKQYELINKMMQD